MRSIDHNEGKRLHAISSGISMSATRSAVHEHLQHITSNRSEIRSIEPELAANDVEFLAQIGYKQELRRSYGTLQVFGVAYSIMGLLPSIISVLAMGLNSGPAALTWGWLLSAFFIMCMGILMAILSSLIPTSGGLYYWTNYYAPDLIRVPLSFLIGCSNTLALCSGVCLINDGFASQVLAAVLVSKEGNFNMTNGILYGVFAAAVVTQAFICSCTTKFTAHIQTLSMIINSVIIVIFFIAVPIGASKDGFNDGGYIFSKLGNERTWSQGWSFMLSIMPAIWSIGCFDSCLHMAEEAANPQKSVPIGIMGSIGVCGVVGWCICIVSVACIKGGNLDHILNSNTGLPMAQIIYDALGKRWTIGFMSVIAFGQYLMGCSILIAVSRQTWAFARDDGLPLVHNIVKYVDPRIQVPIRAIIFDAILSLVLGLLMLIGTTASNALFSMAVSGNYFAWATPVLLAMLPVGRSRFKPGSFYLGKFWSEVVNVITVLWAAFIIVLAMFPDYKLVEPDTMNYTCVITGGVWLLSIIYYYVYGYRVYSGPKSNIDSEEEHSVEKLHYQNVDQVLQKQ